MATPAPGTGSLLLVPFLDEDGDGVRDPGEALYAQTFWATTSTDLFPTGLIAGTATAQGYAFDSLPPGSYRFGIVRTAPIGGGLYMVDLVTATVAAGADTTLVMAVPEPEPLRITLREDHAAFVATISGRDPEYLIGTDPEHGTLLVGQIDRPGGPLYYVPNRDFTGTDRFTLERPFGMDFLPTPVEVTVTPEAQTGTGPNARDDVFVVEAGTDLLVPKYRLLANDEIDGFVDVLGTSRNSTGGSVITEYDDIRFSLSGGTTGTGSFRYGIADSAGADVASVTVRFVDRLPGATEAADRLNGTAGTDLVLGLGGDDLLAGFNGDDALVGGSGNDTLRGGAGRDDLQGDAGDDALDGGAGDDTLQGGSGADRMRGGGGEDVFILDNWDYDYRQQGFDHIIDFEGAGAAGGDKLLLIARFGIDVSLTYERHAPGWPDLQFYRFTVDDFSQRLLLQMADGGSQRLSAEDYSFVL